jgi:N-acetylmuramoyl-L-alanine amidase
MKFNCAIFPLLLAIIMGAIFSLGACAQINKQGSSAKVAPARVAEIVQAPIPQEPIGFKKGSLLLVYPRGENNNRIDSASTFLVGAVPPGRSLTCDGQPVRVNVSGYFGHVVKLNYGKNSFTLVLSGQEQEPLTVVVERPAPDPALSESSFNILPESLEPREAIGVTTGDIIQFAARGTPGCKMSVQFGVHNIGMRPALCKQGKKTSVNLGLDTAFGVSFQRTPAAVKDLYLGFYKVQAEDKFANAVPNFVLQKGAKQIKAKAKGTLTVVHQPSILSSVHDDTIVRLGPGAARVTPLPAGVRFLCDGYKGDWWRLELSPNQHVWIAKNDLSAEDESNALPQSKITTVNMDSDPYGARVAIPLNQRLPFHIEQDLNSKKLVLHIYGATADTDFITTDLHPAAESAAGKLIDYMSWKQKGDSHYELTAHLNHKQQWGYYGEYLDNTLILHIKNAPALDLAAGSLRGTTICLDPGHGGRETGSIGCSGVKEATVNLAIASKLAAELKKLGANIIMTRTSDIDVSLQERVDIASAARADLLISVHNNALPDGRDPWVEHGTSSYWYHPHSIEAARLAQKELSAITGLKDFGSRYQNLFLCRPSRMPAFLMEIAFMINPDEQTKLLDPQFQETTAQSIANSVRKFLLEKVGAEQAVKPGSAPAN